VSSDLISREDRMTHKSKLGQFFPGDLVKLSKYLTYPVCIWSIPPNNRCSEIVDRWSASEVGIIMSGNSVIDSSSNKYVFVMNQRGTMGWLRSHLLEQVVSS